MLGNRSAPLPLEERERGPTDAVAADGVAEEFDGGAAHDADPGDCEEHPPS
jgi:hypothetical protein